MLAIDSGQTKGKPEAVGDYISNEKSRVVLGELESGEFGNQVEDGEFQDNGQHHHREQLDEGNDEEVGSELFADEHGIINWMGFFYFDFIGF